MRKLIVFWFKSKISDRTGHTFSKGSTAGTFMYSMLELMPFNQYLKKSWLAKN